jgi:MFS family permease
MTSVKDYGWRTPLVVFLTACLLLFVSFGTRAGFGLYLQPVSSDLGWGREVFGLAIAIQNVMVGFAQPFTSAFADRFGTGRMIVVGGLLYASGLALMSHASSPTDAYLGLGVLTGLGLSGTSFAIVFGAVGRVVPDEKRSMALGLAGSIGSIGQFTMVPVGQALLTTYGWPTVLMILAVLMLITLPIAGVLKGRPIDHGPGQSLRQALHEAGSHNGYRLLVTGFFVCGFHVAYIGTHLPAYIVDQGLPPQIGAWALGLVGLFNIVGSASAGFIGGKFSKPYLLSCIYFGRAALFVAFVLLPMTETTALIFGATMGLMWLSTVPVTSALVAQIFGPRYMGTLFGIVFFSHQMGAFLGAWFGGYIYDRTGSYDIVWWVAAGLGVLAGFIHLPINAKPVPRLSMAAD